MHLTIYSFSEWISINFHQRRKSLFPSPSPQHSYIMSLLYNSVSYNEHPFAYRIVNGNTSRSNSSNSSSIGIRPSSLALLGRLGAYLWESLAWNRASINNDNQVAFQTIKPPSVHDTLAPPPVFRRPSPRHGHNTNKSSYSSSLHNSNNNKDNTSDAIITTALLWAVTQEVLIGLALTMVATKLQRYVMTHNIMGSFSSLSELFYSTLAYTPDKTDINGNSSGVKTN